jgi:hypothetical protein
LRSVRTYLAIIALLTSLAASSLAPAAALASGISVTRNTVEHSFAQQVTFKLEATADAEISQVYLFFRATSDEETEKKRIALSKPSREVTLEVTHDLRRYPLPPFADITYWWQLEDEAGHQLKTPTRHFEYTDNRFLWGQLKGDGITIQWIEGQGDPAFAQTALDIARASVQDIRAELRVQASDPLDIYIYDSKQNLEAAMVLTGRDWVGGQARPELGVVVTAIPPEQGYSSRMQRDLPHEITHLLIHELTTPEGYGHVPDWLNEGLATNSERLPTPEYALALKEAREEGRLLPLEELCVPFSPDPRTAMLSYAQSASVVSFIREEYGSEAIRELLSAYADGASCRSGLEEALSVSLSQLESNWRMSLEPEAGWRAVVEQGGAWIALWLLTLLVAVPMIGGIRRRRKP